MSVGIACSTARIDRAGVMLVIVEDSLDAFAEVFSAKRATVRLASLLFSDGRGERMARIDEEEETSGSTMGVVSCISLGVSNVEKSGDGDLAVSWTMAEYKVVGQQQVPAYPEIGAAGQRRSGLAGTCRRGRYLQILLCNHVTDGQRQW